MTRFASALFGLFAGFTTQIAHPMCDELRGSDVRVIVPNSTGSSYDSYVRRLQPALKRYLEADIYIDNMPGGGGIVAARTLSASIPNGRTFGIMNGAGLLTAQFTGRNNVPSLLTDFEILGKASPMQHVWAVSSDSKFNSIGDLRRTALQGPIVLGVRNIASTSFASLAIGAHLLGLPHVIISGYASNRETRLAAMRGEVDLVSMDVSSGARLLANGSLRALLQISERSFESSVDLTNADTLADHVEISDELNKAPASMAVALIKLLQANKLFVAPAGLPPTITHCLQTALSAALEENAAAGSHLASASNIKFIDEPTTRAELRAIVDALPIVEPIVRTAAERLR